MDNAKQNSGMEHYYSRDNCCSLDGFLKHIAKGAE